MYSNKFLESLGLDPVEFDQDYVQEDNNDSGEISLFDLDALMF